MDSRDILPKTETVQFLLDTKSLDGGAHGNSPILGRLLPYNNYDDFEFLRTPDPIETEILQNIEAYEVEKDAEENNQVIEWDSETRTVLAARYIPEIYEHWVDDVDWNEPEPSADDLEFMDLFSEMIRAWDEYVEILITLNEAILKNRRLIEHQICRYKQGRMHIMTPSEAAEFAGIYMRENNDFIFYMPHSRVPKYTTDFPLWYSTFLRVLIQHFTADQKGYLESMLDRFQSLLIGIDKIGEEYYRGTGNRTDQMTRYHFNNGISLLTGICDVLALHTKDKYGIQIPDRRTNLRTGKFPLLKELRDHNQEAWEHVHQNHELIELLHIVRNDIIHQSGVIKPGPGFSYREHSETTEWKSQTIWMEELSEKDRENFRKYYKELGDSVEEYDPVTKWGVVTGSDNPPEIYPHTQIEPYRFLKQATKELAEFADEYLRLLGHPNRVEESSEHGRISRNHVQILLKKGLHPFLDDVNPESV